jgi:hypothetical protein
MVDKFKVPVWVWRAPRSGLGKPLTHSFCCYYGSRIGPYGHQKDYFNARIEWTGWNLNEWNEMGWSAISYDCEIYSQGSEKFLEFMQVSAPWDVPLLLLRLRV